MNLSPTNPMNQHISDFLEALLWVADNPDQDERPLEGATIHQFTPAFRKAVDGFISGFLQYLEACDFDMERLDSLERSIGGNVFFSLSGHGCGFFDESDSELGDELQAHLETYAGGRPRFEELEYILGLSDEGTIDLSILPEFLDARRARLFLAPWVQDAETWDVPWFEATSDGFNPANGATPAAALASFYAANPATV